MQYTLTPTRVYHSTGEVLVEHLRLSDYQRTCPVWTLLSVVFAACAQIISVSAAAVGLRRAPSKETVRKALRANLSDLATTERRLNEALRATTPRRLGQRQRLSIDLTLTPYHGQPYRDGDELYRGQVKSGTTHFHAYATAYLVRHGTRVTVALTFVRAGEEMAEVLKRLLRTARRAGVRPDLLLLDRGFYSVPVVRYLQLARQPFLMPVPIRGRTADHPKGPGGTRAFSYWKRSGLGRHRLKRTGGSSVSVGICVHCRNRSGRRGRHGRERLVYAYWGWQPPAPARVSELYRSRFGIESSYRQMNQCRARTSSRDPVVRLFLVGVALVLRNVWVWLHWEVLSAQRRGRRQVRLKLLPLKALLLMLWQVAGEWLEFAAGPTTERPIPARLGPHRSKRDIGNY